MDIRERGLVSASEDSSKGVTSCEDVKLFGTSGLAGV